MIIDCDSCEVRGLACGDCVVTALLGAPPSGVELDDGECAALDALAESGLVPPLRLVIPVSGTAFERGQHADIRDVQDVGLITDQERREHGGDGRSVAAG